MNDNLELYLEEQRTLTIGLLDSVKLLNTKIDEQIKQYTPPPKEVGVSGKLEVNTEKSVEITNLNTIKDWLSDVAQSITQAISEIETHKVVSVENIATAKADNVSITNLSELKKYFEILKDSIENKNFDVVVEKQNIVFPKNPKDAIPVRLSDGKSFYNAIVSAITSGGASIASYINDVGALPTDSPTLATRLDDSSDPILYVGKAPVGSNEADAVWQIAKLDTSSGLSKTWAGNAGFTQVWDDRSLLTYN